MTAIGVMPHWPPLLYGASMLTTCVHSPYRIILFQNSRSKQAEPTLYLHSLFIHDDDLGPGQQKEGRISQVKGNPLQSIMLSLLMIGTCIGATITREAVGMKRSTLAVKHGRAVIRICNQNCWDSSCCGAWEVQGWKHTQGYSSTSPAFSGTRCY